MMNICRQAGMALVAFFRVWRDLGLRAALGKVYARIRFRSTGRGLQEDYQRWIRTTEPSSEELQQQREAAKSLSYRPLISIITPVFNPPPHILEQAIESVISQTYDHWEMCIADASTEDPSVRDVLQGFSHRDSRIKVRYLKKNEGIAGNSNQALKQVEGDFIAILDHDDLLAPNALYEVVRALDDDPEMDIFYFDEDKLSSDGKIRRDPWFKPDWSPELFLSVNYLMHSVVRRELVERVGGFDTSMDGAQDWDLLLRCTEESDKIHHIPKVLYHWREIRGSAASDLLAKPWVFENQLSCVRNHLERSGIQGADAHFEFPGFLRITWPVRGSKVSIIIPSREQVEVLRRCIHTIQEHTTYDNYEILVVDNDSQEKDTHTFYRSLVDEADIRIIPFPGRFNFSAANNLGARKAGGEILLFLNNDIEVLAADWLEEMMRWAERPEIGVVGAKLLYPNGLIQHAGVIVGMQGHASHVYMGYMEKQTGPFGSVDWYRDYCAVTGACMMMRKDTFQQVGGFDEGYQLVFSDVELCLRVRENGYRIVYTPYARLRHYEGRSRGYHIPTSDMLRGYEHLRKLVETGDPYFNPNLSYSEQVPVIIRPDEEPRLDRLMRLVGISKEDLSTSTQP
jgi:GT2 family glycosyltransferase